FLVAKIKKDYRVLGALVGFPTLWLKSTYVGAFYLLRSNYPMSICAIYSSISEEMLEHCFYFHNN
ncbi:hypothetical protein, partial [Bacillus sp. AFS054943]|uniref:hypothetical protein n=1 Tax=Bacillus sp. AFS054943 TaxID=2033506 RepID=UPI001C3F23D3